MESVSENIEGALSSKFSDIMATGTSPQAVGNDNPQILYESLIRYRDIPRSERNAAKFRSKSKSKGNLNLSVKAKQLKPQPKPKKGDNFGMISVKSHLEIMKSLTSAHAEFRCMTIKSIYVYLVKSFQYGKVINIMNRKI